MFGSRPLSLLGTSPSCDYSRDEFFASLSKINYGGQIVIESFLPTVKEIARAVSAWRPVAPSMDALAIDGLEFIKSMAAKHLDVK
jgi:D-psicose/D-tagatose/L-ribulose 3-epimerase